MDYSLIGILALITLFISNHDVLFKKRRGLPRLSAAYRDFLLAVAFFYVSDILWGIFEDLSLRTPLFIDTEVYFIAMALGILFLTRYAASYLEEKTVFRALLLAAGRFFCCGVVIIMILNVFFPLVFIIDENCVYYPAVARYVVLGFQIVTLLLTSVYAFYGARKEKDLVRKRFLTIGLFGITMLLSISMQWFFPLLPLYSIGYLLGCALIRAFIVESEKEEVRTNMENALRREQQQSQELKTAWKLAYTDALTGAKSKLAYIEKENQINERLQNGTLNELAVVVFDLNSMKQVNDAFGHVAGDQYIKSGYDLISEFFKNSPVFRVGGDEFIVMPEGQDFSNRNEILASFNNRVIKNTANGSIVIAFGVAEYMPGKDKTCQQIVERADQLMYEQKEFLKKLSVPFANK